jgi:hypothetical protein
VQVFQRLAKSPACPAPDLLSTLTEGNHCHSY